MGFMHANKFSELLAWWTLDKATRSRTHTSFRLASEQVSNRFQASFGPASIMDFGLKYGVTIIVQARQHERRDKSRHDITPELSTHRPQPAQMDL